MGKHVFHTLMIFWKPGLSKNCYLPLPQNSFLCNKSASDAAELVAMGMSTIHKKSILTNPYIDISTQNFNHLTGATANILVVTIQSEVVLTYTLMCIALLHFYT